MVDVIDKAVEAIRTRLQELHDEERRLREALTSLGPDSAGARRKPSRRRRRKAAAPKRAGVAPAAAKAAPRGRRREQFLVAVKEAPGRTATEIAEAIGVSPSQAHTLARKAHADKLVSKRNKKYYPRRSSLTAIPSRPRADELRDTAGFGEVKPNPDGTAPTGH